MTHELKVLPEYFLELVLRTKTFEVRKNDRNYQTGDILKLKEFDGENFTGDYVTTLITYILDDEKYCKKDYVIIGFRFLSDMKIIDRRS